MSTSMRHDGSYSRPAAPAGYRWLRPHEHRKPGDCYAPDSPISRFSYGQQIHDDSILRPIKRKKQTDTRST